MFQIKMKRRSYFKHLSFARQRFKSRPRKDYWIDKSIFFTGRMVRCPNDSSCNIENYSSDEINSKCQDPLFNERLYGSRETDDEKLLFKSAVLVENTKSEEERSLSPILSGIKSSNERYSRKDKLQSPVANTGFTEDALATSSDYEEDEPSKSPILGTQTCSSFKTFKKNVGRADDHCQCRHTNFSSDEEDVELEKCAVGTSTPKKIDVNSVVRSPLVFPNFEDFSLEMNKKSVVTYKKVKATRKRRSELAFTKLVGKSLMEDSDLEIVEEPSTSSAPRHLSENEISVCIEEDHIEFQEMPKKKDVKGEYSEFKSHSKEVVKIRQPKKNGKEACVLNRLKDSNFWFKAAIASRKDYCYKIVSLKMAPPLVIFSAKPWNEEKDEAVTDISCTEKWFAYNINLWRLCGEPAEEDLIYISMEFSATLNFSGRDFILPYFMDRPSEIKFSRNASLPVIATVYSSCDEESHREWEENSDDNTELALTDVVKDNGSQLTCVSRNEEESELFGPLGSDWFSQI